MYNVSYNVYHVSCNVSCIMSKLTDQLPKSLSISQTIISSMFFNVLAHVCHPFRSLLGLKHMRNLFEEHKVLHNWHVKHLNKKGLIMHHIHSVLYILHTLKCKSKLILMQPFPYIQLQNLYCQLTPNSYHPLMRNMKQNCDASTHMLKSPINNQLQPLITLDTWGPQPNASKNLNSITKKHPYGSLHTICGQNESWIIMTKPK